MLKLEQIHVKGTPAELGQGQGEHLRERVQRFVEMRLSAVQGYFADRGKPAPDAIIAEGEKALAILEKWDPEGAEEHRGIAAGANVDPIRLYTAANMTDLRDVLLLSAPSGPPIQKLPADAEGCSSVLVPGSHTVSGKPLVGQTWDLNPPDVEYVVGIHRTPTNGPRTWSVTCGGCLTLVGMNEHGVAVGTTNIKVYGSKPGVGYMGILHRAIKSKSAAEAKAAVQGAPHAGAHTYWIADADMQLEWESSPNGSHLRDTASGPVVRTNHCIAGPHVEIQGELPSESSHKRFARITGLVGDGDVSVDSMQKLFANREDGIYSVNRYEEDGQGTATNSVFVASPVDRIAWACRGPADRGEWVELRP